MVLIVTLLVTTIINLYNLTSNSSNICNIYQVDIETLPVSTLRGQLVDKLDYCLQGSRT